MDGDTPGILGVHFDKHWVNLYSPDASKRELAALTNHLLHGFPFRKGLWLTRTAHAEGPWFNPL